MRALLMYEDRDFAPVTHQVTQRLVFDVPRDIPDASDRTHDLGLDVVLGGMAGDDPFLLSVATAALLIALTNDVGTVCYRQEILKDGLAHPELIRELYRIAVEGITTQQRASWRYTSRFPGGVVYDAIDTLGAFRSVLRRIRAFADDHGTQFTSRGMCRLMTTLRHELDDTFFAELEEHLRALEFKQGVLASAGLGEGNEGIGYVLHQSHSARPAWLARVLGDQPPGFTIRVPERDYAGARAMADIRERAILRVANIAAEAAEHVLSFFQMLATELAFYVSCLNLYDVLTSLRLPICLPEPAAIGTRKLHFAELYDVSLALSAKVTVEGNSLDLDGKSIVVVTGANQGGKSSFLRSVGLAQLMMHSGMFVGAAQFTGELCTGLFTHYTREEDDSMQHGKLDEELGRLSDIADAITPNAMLLLNESFAATNEREGSEIARQVVRALSEKHVKIIFVTHLYEFARDLFKQGRGDTLFLRAERLEDGTRTFRMLPGEPLATSYGRDLYHAIFDSTIGEA